MVVKIKIRDAKIGIFQFDKKKYSVLAKIPLLCSKFQAICLHDAKDGAFRLANNQPKWIAR